MTPLLCMAVMMQSCRKQLKQRGITQPMSIEDVRAFAEKAQQAEQTCFLALHSSDWYKIKIVKIEEERILVNKIDLKSDRCVSKKPKSIKWKWIYALCPFDTEQEN